MQGRFCAPEKDPSRKKVKMHDMDEEHDHNAMSDADKAAMATPREAECSCSRLSLQDEPSSLALHWLTPVSQPV